MDHLKLPKSFTYVTIAICILSESIGAMVPRVTSKVFQPTYAIACKMCSMMRHHSDASVNEPYLVQAKIQAKNNSNEEILGKLQKIEESMQEQKKSMQKLQDDVTKLKAIATMLEGDVIAMTVDTDDVRIPYTKSQSVARELDRRTKLYERLINENGSNKKSLI
ncbi:MAG TPA: hypothetical protein VLG50_04770 [Candidatus Saccharimonadales bacterium]|nr:hypothetical protein [Candidatus Saccharimonadales bacterium]